MQPLGGDLEADSPVRSWFRQTCLGAEEGLVLHAELVSALDHDLVGSLEPRVEAVADLDAAQDIALRVQGRRTGTDRLLRIGGRRERLERDLDRRDASVRECGRLGGHDRHRLTVVADAIRREHGLVGDLEPVGRASRDILVGEGTADARYAQRRGHVK